MKFDMTKDGWKTKFNDVGDPDPVEPVVEPTDPVEPEPPQSEDPPVEEPPVEPEPQKVEIDLESLKPQFEEMIKNLFDKFSATIPAAQPPVEEKNDMGDVDVNKIREELEAKMQQDKADLEAKLRRSELRAFTEQKIREAGNEVIPELVKGDTEEEVLASIEASKNRFKQIVEQGAASVTPPAAPPVDPAASSAAVPSAVKPDAAQVTELDLSAIDNMPVEDLQKNWSSIKKQALAGYQYGS